MSKPGSFAAFPKIGRHTAGMMPTHTNNGMSHVMTTVETPAGVPMKPQHLSVPKHITGHRGTPRLRNAQPPAST